MTNAQATITETSIILVQTDAMNIARTIDYENRPATFNEADTFLAFNSLRRTAAWELGEKGSVTAPVELIDNRFNGTVAARLDQAIGTTHDQYQVLPIIEVEDGDLICDLDLSAPYVVAGFRQEGSTIRVHMVGEGKTWEDRFTTDFPAARLVQIARRKA
jgi:hypothetical protein